MSNFRKRIMDFSDYIARRVPTSLIRPFTLPLIYQTRAADSLFYESNNMINMAFAYLSNNKIAGDYAEFGVFRGHATIEAWNSKRRHGHTQMKFWLFDSFEGLPEVKNVDSGGPFETAEFSFTRIDYEKRLRKFGVAVDELNIVPGFFDESLPKLKTESKIAIAWIDCDLYESTVPVLEWLTDKLVDGAVICFDDWYTFKGDPDKGEQRACAVWLARNPSIKLCLIASFTGLENRFWYIAHS